MKTLFIVLAQRRGRNDAANQWLAENPLILGLLFLAIGGGVAAYGAYELRTGVARDKSGRVVEGGTGKALGWVRLVAGIGFALFGLYKMIAG